jgi:tetratricopeptide (TPR) repeat protein
MVRRADTARLEPVAQRTSADLVAQREYLAGVERFSIGDLAGADTAFTRAVARDPGFAQALYQLAITRWWGGEPESAIEEIGRARANAQRLSPGERDLLAGLELLVRRDFGAAVPAFERGFTTKSRESNSGIGLHWCANAIHALGGNMRAEKPEHGRGASFVVVLPLRESGTGVARAA